MSVSQKKTEYVLMNKDCRMLSFLCCRNEYDEPTFRNCSGMHPTGRLAIKL